MNLELVASVAEIDTSVLSWPRSANGLAKRLMQVWSNLFETEIDSHAKESEYKSRAPPFWMYSKKINTRKSVMEKGSPFVH